MFCEYFWVNVKVLVVVNIFENFFSDLLSEESLILCFLVFKLLYLSEKLILCKLVFFINSFYMFLLKCFIRLL